MAAGSLVTAFSRGPAFAIGYSAASVWPMLTAGP